MVLIVDCGSSKTPFIEEIVDEFCDFRTIPFFDLTIEDVFQFIGIIFSVIAGIFFEKSPLKTKLKRLISIILFVWAIYNLFQSLLNKKDNSYGIDSDGDGISDGIEKTVTEKLADVEQGILAIKESGESLTDNKAL